MSRYGSWRVVEVFDFDIGINKVHCFIMEHNAVSSSEQETIRCRLETEFYNLALLSDTYLGLCGFDTFRSFCMYALLF